MASAIPLPAKGLVLVLLFTDVHQVLYVESWATGVGISVESAERSDVQSAGRNIEASSLTAITSLPATWPASLTS